MPDPIPCLTGEGLVNTAIIVQARDVTAILPIKTGEIAADQNMAVRERKNLLDDSVGASTDIESGIEQTGRRGERKKYA